KTRLAAATTALWASQVAEAFLLDVIDRFAACEAKRVLAYAPAGCGPYFSAIAHERFACVPQYSADLGQRLHDFVRDQLHAGAQKVVIVGTDTPTLPPSFIAQAFDALAQADLVLGPATDGGYYLVGCGRHIPPIFDDVAWSSANVLAETVARLADPSWRLA